MWSFPVVLLLGASAAASVSLKASIDMSAEASAMPHYWKKCFGSGHTLLGTRSDWQEHMARAASELGVQGLRMHGALDDDLSITPRKGEYHFYSLDIVYDNMLKHGVRPIVELSFMPKALVACGEEAKPTDPSKPCDWAFNAVGSYRSLTMPPDDFNDWYNLVKALAAHMVERHGIAEVSQWKFEVWNEMWGIDYPHPYLELYNASARAVKAVHPALQIGGPASAGVQYIQDFVDDTKRLGIPVDFVSTHSYPSDGYCSRTADPDCFPKTLLKNRDIAQKAGYPFLITEYKDGLQGGPGTSYGGKHGDMAYAAAFIFHTIPQLTDLDAFSWWTISDVFEEGWLRGAPFYGGYGLLTSQGVAKPAYRAFELLNGAGDQRIPVAVTGQAPVLGGPPSQTTPVTVFATTHSSGSTVGAKGLKVFASNFWPEVGASSDPREPNCTTVSVTVSNLPATVNTAILYRIDDNVTSPYLTWLQWNTDAVKAGKCNSQCDPPDSAACPCLNYLTPTQIAELDEISQPQQEIISIDKGGTFDITLAAYASVMVEFQD